jgi:hypothetical protein
MKNIFGIFWIVSMFCTAAFADGYVVSSGHDNQEHCYGVASNGLVSSTPVADSLCSAGFVASPTGSGDTECFNHSAAGVVYGDPVPFQNCQSSGTAAASLLYPGSNDAGEGNSNIGAQHETCINISSEGAQHQWLGKTPSDTSAALGDIGMDAEIEYLGRHQYLATPPNGFAMNYILIRVLSPGTTITGPGSARVGAIGWIFQDETSCL